MKVIQESLTVLANVASAEVNIILGGFRVTLTAAESLQLANGLANCLEQLQGMEKPGAPAEAWSVGRSGEQRPVAAKDAEAEAVQQRARALIQASMRDKGFSLLETPRE
ncbi:MAG TPA: hypothetical protein VLX85_17260 [Stellaceae bacterium]|nr:hypothetical protein [Stellaceae bacterium]